MQQSLIAMCGLAFSGKSTFAQRLSQDIGVELIVFDQLNEMRGLSGGDGSMTPSDWNETHIIALKKASSFLENGHSVILDDTFSHRFLRDRAAALATTKGCEFLVVYFDTPLHTITERRQKNDKTHTRPTISDGVFDAHFRSFQAPTPDEPIIRITPEEEIEEVIQRFFQSH